MSSSVVERACLIRGAVEADPGLRGDPAVLRELRALEALIERDPLASFVPNPAQVAWYEASSRIVAAFAGNRFGKTTSLVVRCLIECVDRDSLPRHLQAYKRWDGDTAPRGTHCRIVCPSFALLDANLIESFRRWAPADQLAGGSFDKAYKGPPTRRLSFANGSFVEFMVYEQDLDKFGGTARHVVGYDEPPPEDIRQECLFRTVDYGGYEMFAVTPLKVNTGWLRREVYKKRESPDITVIQGSIHDNPLLDEAAKLAALGSANDLWRRAREFGEFVEMGGLVFAEWERRVVDPPAPGVVRGQDVVVSIDPGVRNCGIVFCCFDSENIMGVFDELLLQDDTPSGYDTAIRGVLKRWGVRLDRVSFVIDPASRQRAQVNAETVESALHRLGIHCVPGQNNVDAGIQQLRDRMAAKVPRFWCSKACRILRDQADEYAAEDRQDGEFKVIKKNDHCFVAGTLVATERGDVPIEDVRMGDRVWTRSGLRPVVAAAVTRGGRPQATVTLTTQDGRTLTGTPDHEVWVEGRGFIAMDALRYGDILSAWNPSGSTGCPTGDTPTLRAAPTGSTSRPPTTPRVSNVCIAPSGPQRTVPFQADTTSITSTVTRSTTPCPTCGASRPKSTSGSTCLPSAASGSASMRNAFAPSLRSGIALKKATPGTSSRAATLGMGESRSTACASNAASPSNRSSLAASAPMAARARGGERAALTTGPVLASSARATSPSTGTPSSGLVVDRVQAVCPASPSVVYNLTVYGRAEFFAGGLLVHNCLDAVRYAAMHMPWYPAEEAAAPKRMLGYQQNFAPSLAALGGPAPDVPPMGCWS